jgi:hypothetical protein
MHPIKIPILPELAKIIEASPIGELNVGKKWGSLRPSRSRENRTNCPTDRCEVRI